MIQKQAVTFKGSLSSIWNGLKTGAKYTGKGLAYSIPGYERVKAISKAFKRLNPNDWFPGVKRFFNSDASILAELDTLSKEKLAKYTDELETIGRQLDSGSASSDLLSRRDTILKEMEAIIGGPVNSKINHIIVNPLVAPNLPQGTPQQNINRLNTVIDRMNRATRNFQNAIKSPDLDIPKLPTVANLDDLLPAGDTFKGAKAEYARRYGRLQEAYEQLKAHREGKDVLQEFKKVLPNKLNISNLEAARLPGRIRSGVVVPTLAMGALGTADYMTGGYGSDLMGKITGLHPIESLKKTITSPMLEAANKLKNAKQLQKHIMFAGGGALAGGLMGGDASSAALGGLAGGAASYLGSDKIKPYETFEEALKDVGMKDMV